MQDDQKGQPSHPPNPAAGKTASLPRDAPFRRQGRSERTTMVLPNLLMNILPRMARMSPPTARVARAQGTHRAIHPLLAGFFSILLDGFIHIGRSPKGMRCSSSPALPRTLFHPCQKK